MIACNFLVLILYLKTCILSILYAHQYFQNIFFQLTPNLKQSYFTHTKNKLQSYSLTGGVKRAFAMIETKEYFCSSFCQKSSKSNYIASMDFTLPSI